MNFQDGWVCGAVDLDGRGGRAVVQCAEYRPLCALLRQMREHVGFTQVQVGE